SPEPAGCGGDCGVFEIALAGGEVGSLTTVCLTCSLVAVCRMTPATLRPQVGANALFAGILLAMRIGIARWGIAASLDGQLRPALLSFALLLAPLWFFGFGLGEWLAQRLRSPWSRVALSALLGVPYLVFAFPAGSLRWSITVVVVLLPVVLSATLESSASTRNLVWQDGLVLGT